MYEYGKMKLVKTILRMREGIDKNDGSGIFS
jgi:hypothetical protein